VRSPDEVVCDVPVRFRMRASLLGAALAATLALPAGAHADGGALQCEASAVRVQAGAAPAVEPATANRGAPHCRTASAALGASGLLPAPLSAPALTARTALEGPDGQVALQRATATGEVTGLRVAALADLPLPALEIPDAVGVVSLPLPPPLDAPIALRPALRALVTAPAVDAVRAEIVTASATARCTTWGPQLEGSSRVGGLTVLGQPVSEGQDMPVTIDTAAIDPSDIDLSLVQLPPGVSLDLVRAPLQAVLETLPDVAVPDVVAHVSVRLNHQERTADRLTQRALGLKIGVGGQTLLDLTAGEAAAGAAGPGCTTPAELELACTKRRLVLVDVLERGGRVRLVGVADRALAGRTVDLRLVPLDARDRARVVARVKVGADGWFRASAPLPPRRIRATNDARYMAVAGAERSLRLKLRRRMTLTGVTSRAGRVTISGRLSAPLGRPASVIVVKRRLSCRRMEVAARVRPSSTGGFRVTVPAPQGVLAAVYRLETSVPKTTRNPKRFPTYTLPRSVTLT
jgi:hypothetical protein